MVAPHTHAMKRKESFDECSNIILGIDSNVVHCTCVACRSKHGAANEDVDVHLQSAAFTRISISFVWSRPKSHFQTEHVQWSDGGQREALITVEIVFIIGVKADDTKQEEKFAIHEIQQLFFIIRFSRFSFFVFDDSRRNSISIMGRGAHLNKVVPKPGLGWVTNLHTSKGVPNNNCAYHFECTVT